MVNGCYWERNAQLWCPSSCITDISIKAGRIGGIDSAQRQLGPQDPLMGAYLNILCSASPRENR